MNRAWLETHFEVVDAIATATMDETWEYTMCAELGDSEGYNRTMLYDLSIQWTDEFEKLHEGREWDGEWMEEVWKFMENKLYGNKND